METCCTCATTLQTTAGDGSSEKTPSEGRRLECCGRLVCGDCIQKHPRFRNYCPYCQLSTAPSSLPQGGLKEPPSYNVAVVKDDSAPPPYAVHQTLSPSPRSLQSPSIDEKGALPGSGSAADQAPAPDTLHFLHHAHDTIASLSLRYNVPAPVLRRANNLTSDHLLVARRTIIVPGSHYRGGVSLSPRPIEGEEEEMRKGKIRRWMVATKVPEYDVAVFYLEQAEYDVEAAMEKYLDDERWERENPLDASSQTRVHGKGKGRATGIGSSQSIGDWRWVKPRAMLRKI